MANDDQTISIPVEADLSGFSNALTDLSKQSRSFAAVFSSTMRGAVTSGKSFEDTLRTMALRLSDVALRAGMRPLESLASNAISALFSGIGGGSAGAAMPTGVVPFAKGGVVSAPTYFPMPSGTGLMGEAGTEAILPLARGSDGNLGVRSGGAGQAVNVTFNISTPDVAGFAKSQGQVSAMLARTVGRGRRGL